jgi:hypothetical protein
VRLDIDDVDRDEIRGLITDVYRLVAPKTLVELVD